MYRYALIDPSARPRPDPLTLGVEVTSPAHAACCGLGNIDPQHAPGAAPEAPAAIRASLDWPLPPEGAQLVTIRPDLDALGAMAVLTLRAEGVEPDAAMLERIDRVARADRFDRGPWPGPRPLPATLDDLLEDGDGAEVAAMSAAAFDSAEPVAERVARIARWLAAGEVPPTYRDAWEARASRLLRSLRLGATRVEPAAGGRVAAVISLEPGALRLGYRLAPVVVALNPAFAFPGERQGRKFTVAQYAAGHADLHAAAAALAEMEPVWGGSATIKGSPQDRPSGLCLEDVTDAVARVLLQDRRDSREDAA